MARVWTQSASHPGLPPGNPGATRSIVCFHGAESHSGWFGPFALDALGAGHWSAVIARDRPGWRGDLRSREEAYAWIVGSLAEARRDQASGHGIDVIATSWGALAVLACLIDCGSAGWENVKTIHLVAPAIFPDLGLQRLMLVGAIKDSIAGGGFLSGRLRTMLDPSHFSDCPDVRSRLAADPRRNTELSPAFWIVTAGMRRLVRQGASSYLLRSQLRDTGTRLFLHLAEQDSVIDLQRTEDFLTRAGAGLFRYPSRCHAILMQYPLDFARAMASCLSDEGAMRES